MARMTMSATTTVVTQAQPVARAAIESASLGLIRVDRVRP
jgi:hypothetical protein